MSREIVSMTFRLTQEARDMLMQRAKEYGISMTAMLELLIRGKVPNEKQGGD
jgi:replication initiation and membrane attachment protein DnaB